MLRLMISFKRDETDRFGISSRPYDFFVKTPDEVLKRFELKDIGF